MSLLNKAVKSMSKKYKGKKPVSKVKRRPVSNETKAHQMENNEITDSPSEWGGLAGNKDRPEMLKRRKAANKIKGGRKKVAGRTKSARTVDVEVNHHSPEYVTVKKITKSVLKGKSPMTSKQLKRKVIQLRALRKRIMRTEELPKTEDFQKKMNLLHNAILKLQSKLDKGSGKVVVKQEGLIKGLDY